MIRLVACVLLVCLPASAAAQSDSVLAARRADSIQTVRELERFTGRIKENGKARAERRAQSLLPAVSAYRFSDGSRCTKANEGRLKKLSQKYPGWSDRAIVGVACAALWIGMTGEQLRESRGRPLGINRTTTADGTQEQWVYGTPGYLADMYVYVDAGLVIAIQD